uniref:Uncharacterized protein n=1 Tax=Hucho hucho TaxID=62062 RepID=A0A4W5L9Z0_9TELE
MLSDRWAGDSWVLKKLLASANEVHTPIHRYKHAEHRHTKTHILYISSLNVHSHTLKHTQLYLLNTPPLPLPQPGVFSQLTMAAEERPWLWVVYILTVGLPIGLTVLFCWPKKSDDDYVYKKVDSPKPDVEEEEDNDDDDDEEEKGDQAAEAKATESPKPAEVKKEKAEEESGAAGGDSVEDEEEDEEEDEGEEEEETKSNEAASDDVSAEQKEEADEGGHSVGDGHKQAVRKRRVRKD